MHFLPYFSCTKTEIEKEVDMKKFTSITSKAVENHPPPSKLILAPLRQTKNRRKKVTNLDVEKKKKRLLKDTIEVLPVDIGTET